MANFRDGNLVQGAPLGATFTSVYLSADDTIVPTAGLGMIWVGSDSATASARTFTLATSGLVGHRLTLYWYTGASSSGELADSGSAKLTSAWTPTQYDVLELVSDGTSWNEIGRGGSSGALAALSVDTANLVASSVTVAKAAPALMAETTGTITSAQLLALTVPVVLVPAPAAGLVVLVDEIELFHDYAVAVYATGADLAIEYATSGDNIALVADTFVTGGADKKVVIRPTIYDLDSSTGTGEGFDITANVAKAVQVVAAAAFTLGNAANIVKYRVRYHTVTALV